MGYIEKFDLDFELKSTLSVYFFSHVNCLEIMTKHITSDTMSVLRQFIRVYTKSIRLESELGNMLFPESVTGASLYNNFQSIVEVIRNCRALKLFGCSRKLAPLSLTITRVLSLTFFRHSRDIYLNSNWLLIIFSSVTSSSWDH